MGHKSRTAQEILEDLIGTLAGREGNYDHPYDNFNRIAEFEKGLHELQEGPEKVALRNICQKMGRLVHGILIGDYTDPNIWKAVEDGWIDIAGYAICGLRITEEIRAAQLEFKERYGPEKVLARLRPIRAGLEDKTTAVTFHSDGGK
jgi:hypothetical protein